MGDLAAENARKTKPRKYWLLLVVVVAAAVLVWVTQYYCIFWRETPRCALWEMVRAVQTNDTPKLFQYIDIPSVADGLVRKSAGDVDSWLLKKGFGADPQEDDVSRLTRSLTKKFAKFITPKVVAALEPQIKVGVEKYLGELTTLEKAGLAAIPAKVEIQQEDDVALVTLTDPQSKQKIRFRMARKPDGGKWQIVEVDYQLIKSLIEHHFKD